MDDYWEVVVRVLNEEFVAHTEYLSPKTLRELLIAVREQLTELHDEA